MKLVVQPRSSQKKGDVKKIRRKGDIPAVMYSAKKETASLIVNGQEFDSNMRSMRPGYLPTTIFTLTDGTKECRAIVKEIQYHVTTYQILHIDFEELIDDVAVTVKVPVNCIGAMDCIGVKLGGAIRQVARHVKVKCSPKQIPTSFDIDVKNANVGDSLRVKDLQGVESGVTVLARDNDAVVVIAKR